EEPAFGRADLHRRRRLCGRRLDRLAIRPADAGRGARRRLRRRQAGAPHPARRPARGHYRDRAGHDRFHVHARLTGAPGRSARSIALPRAASPGAVRTPSRMNMPEFGITQAAQLTGTTPSTLRLWEQHALLSPLRSPTGQRIYGEPDLGLIRTVLRLRKVEG